MVHRSLLLIAVLSVFGMADTGFKDSIQFTETDGAPQCMAGQVKVSAGALTCSGQTATLNMALGSGSTNYIQNTATLQTGATFYVSSGTVNNLAVSSMTTTLPMSARKITDLANGTASTDGAAFGQIPVSNSSTTAKTSTDSSTGATFADTTFGVTITPSSVNAKILLVASGTGFTTTTDSIPCYTITNKTQSHQLGGSLGLTVFNAPAALNSVDLPIAMVAVDSPNSTSAQTYKIQIKNQTGGASTVYFGDVYGTLSAIEIH